MSQSDFGEHLRQVVAVMTRDELLARLRELQSNDDEEIAHHAADEALLDFIDDTEVKEAFDAIPKWYA